MITFWFRGDHFPRLVLFLATKLSDANFHANTYETAIMYFYFWKPTEYLLITSDKARLQSSKTCVKNKETKHTRCPKKSA